MINKNIANLKLNVIERVNYVQSFLSDQYLHEKEFMHYKNDKENVLKQIDKNIKHEIADRLNNNENFTIHHCINKADYLISFISVKNVEGNPVAYIISYHKDKNIIADLKRQFFIIHIISSFLIIIIIFYILLNYLKKLKLKKMDTQYMNIIDANTDIVVVLDKQGIQLYFNKQLEILLGYKRANLIGKSFTEFMPESEIPKSLDALKEIFIKEENVFFESYVIHNKGHFIPVEITAQIMLYDEKKTVVCTIRDIRERREAQQKLIDNEIQQRKILETFKEGIYIVSSEYEIIYANSALQKKIGTKAVGEKCYKAVHNLEKKCRWCIFEDLKKKKESIDYEFETDDNKTLISNNILLDNNSKLTVLADIKSI